MSTGDNLIAWTVQHVARAMEWGDLDSFVRVDLAPPVRYAYIHGALPASARQNRVVPDRVLLVVWAEHNDVQVLAEDRRAPVHRGVSQLIASAALEALDGRYGPGAKLEAETRFRRLYDVDLAERTCDELAAVESVGKALGVIAKSKRRKDCLFDLQKLHWELSSLVGQIQRDA